MEKSHYGPAGDLKPVTDEELMERRKHFGLLRTEILWPRGSEPQTEDVLLQNRVRDLALDTVEKTTPTRGGRKKHCGCGALPIRGDKLHNQSLH